MQTICGVLIGQDFIVNDHCNECSNSNIEKTKRERMNEQKKLDCETTQRKLII